MRQIGLNYGARNIMMVNQKDFQAFAHTPLGKDLFQQEQLFIQNSIDFLLPEYLLQVGFRVGDFRLPEKCVALAQDGGRENKANVLALPSQLPWQTQLFDMVVVAHGLDGVREPQRCLAEWWRVLKPNRRLILTGFNPYSWWRLGSKNHMPNVAQGVALSELKSLLAAHAWQIEQGRFMNYLPPINSQIMVDKLNFLELVGNRWLPHGAAAYGLVLRKEVAGVLPADGAVWADELAAEPTFALARNELAP